MTKKTEDNLFHERTRLAIVIELCNEPDGIQFTVLRDRLALTDGNLSRHLSALEEGKTVRLKKSFVESKPRTTIHLTRQGREAFIDYLDELGALLTKAAQSSGLAETDSSVLRILAQARFKKAWGAKVAGDFFAIKLCNAKYFGQADGGRSKMRCNEMLASEQWEQLFKAKVKRGETLPWDDAYQLTPAERETISRSITKFEKRGKRGRKKLSSTSCFVCGTIGR